MARQRNCPDKMKSKLLPALLPRLRIVSGKNIAFGPGKAKLLALVAETGSIGAAARRMGMSYMRAWSLIQTMNQCFQKPLVLAKHGGRGGGGGAKLTETGYKVLTLYRKMEQTSLHAITSSWKQLRQLLSD
jgi:molybdate transport system regulatory protein